MFGFEEVYPCDPTLLTVCVFRDRRVRVRVVEKEGQGEHFEGRRSVSTMSVSINSELVQRKAITGHRTSSLLRMQYVSKSKRVSFLQPLTTDPQR